MVNGISRRMFIKQLMRLPENEKLMEHCRNEMLQIILHVVRLENDRFIDLTKYLDLADVIEQVYLKLVNGDFSE